LGDAGLREVQRCADFLHRHFFVVVQHDDEAFGPAEPFGQEVLEVAFLSFEQRILAAAILDDVDFVDVLFAVAVTAFGVE